MSNLISRLVMRSNQGEILMRLKLRENTFWKLDIFDKDPSEDWQWAAGAEGRHDHLLRIGIQYAVDRLGADAEPVELS